jgi:formate dehydrogenase subunit gamma
MSSRQPCALVIGLIVALVLGVGPATPASAKAEGIAVPNPGAELWREVRQRDHEVRGMTQVQGPDAGVLINTSGDEWRDFRRQRLVPIGGWMLLGAAGVVLLLALVRPSVPIPGGESGRRLKRFDVARRVGHWLMAALMLFLGLTGLVLLLGRFVLLPWMGPEVFSILASASKEAHDLMGPVFVAALISFFVQFVRMNLPGKGDLGWMVRLGGLIGHKHPAVGFFNPGEKILFWLVVLLGGLLSVSGIAVLFQNLWPGRDLMQAALVGHAVGGLLFIAMVFGHIYLALSVKGLLPAMTEGYVDANWARAHHRHWYDQVEAEGGVEDTPPPRSEGVPAGVGDGRSHS